ncbi:hypothetical protein RMSM_07263 [Rhodopirellula maiorica SM1]|uniref:Uncharacterized protein n=1 Tax=Rhodopirellula maiorica SM1 TaxID=1265738 RepID=M5RPE5_9BACT|nr:hypothetical protein RMSM_07263 [Rhodopirellula maiorica SM1]
MFRIRAKTERSNIILSGGGAFVAARCGGKLTSAKERRGSDVLTNGVAGRTRVAGRMGSD